MAIADAVLLLFLGLGLVSGYKRGFLQVFSGLLSILVGVYASIQFSSFAASFLEKNQWVSEQYLDIASLLLTFFVTVFAIRFGANLIEQILKSIGVNFMNRFVGAVLGLCIHLIIALVLLHYLYPFFTDYVWIKESSYLKDLYQLSNSIFAQLDLNR